MQQVVTFGGKTDQVYRELRRRILMLQLAPGQLLHEVELIEQLGSSRTPIREAVQRLAAERLVVLRPRQTPFVAPILASELAQLSEIRMVLEPEAARLAAERGIAAERKQLKAAAVTFRAMARSGDQHGILSSDTAIHDLISTMSRNAYLSEFTGHLALFSQRIWWLSIRDPGRDGAFITCHDDLIRSVAAGDAEAAVQAAREHVEMFRKRLTQLIVPGIAPAPAPPSSRLPHKRAGAAA